MTCLPEPKSAAAVLKDRCGRNINYLRLSITDRCNLRCHYCMPGGAAANPAGALLSFADLFYLARTVVSAGIEKIRITGGEPLVRPGVEEFLARLGELSGLQRLVLTTNGIGLAACADELARAGVHSLNVSLDSLDPQTFKGITGVAGLPRVLAGIDAALAAGLKVKLNMVPMRGINDAEIPALLKFACERGITLRFIEYMPVYRPANWRRRIIPATEIVETLKGWFELESLPRLPLAGPAQYYRIAEYNSAIGFIAPVFDHICSDCNRIRITAAGRMRGCLFSDEEFDLRPLLQPGREEDLVAAFHHIVATKPEGHQLHQPEQGYSSFSMAAVGG